MNKTEATAKLNNLAAEARAKKYVVGQPMDVVFVADNGVKIGAVRSSGAIRFKVNGVYRSRAYALECITQ